MIQLKIRLPHCEAIQACGDCINWSQREFSSSKDKVIEICNKDFHTTTFLRSESSRLLYEAHALHDNDL